MNLRIHHLLAVSCCLVVSHKAQALDTTPPALNIEQTWIEKAGSVYHFKMNLDPQDNVGVDKIEFRTALNTTAAMPANAPWDQHPWTRGEAFDEGFICTAIVIEIRAKDAAGNASPLQRRTFKAPFPVSLAPNVDPKFVQPPTYLTFSGPTMDCKGLFTANFDGQGREDLLQVDNATGIVKVRRQNNDGTFTSNFFQLTSGTIQDSAIGDFDQDGRMDIALVVNNDVVIYHNEGLGVNDTLTFTPITPPGRTNSGIWLVEHIGVGEFTGDTFPDVVIVGSGDDGAGGSILKAEVIVNDGAGSLFGFNTALGPMNAGAGRIVVGDINGDGHPDVVMADTILRRLILFKWVSNGALGGTDYFDPASRPFIRYLGLKAQAVAIGDIAQRGRNDVVVTEHYYGQLTSPYLPGENHEAMFWEYFPTDDNGNIGSSYGQETAFIGPTVTVDTPFSSDVMVRELTGDRFPEIVMTDELNAGIITARMSVPLDNVNHIYNGYTKTVRTFATAPHPQRLTSGMFDTDTKRDVVVASGNTNQISVLHNSFSTSSKANDIVGGTSTASDPNGSPNGAGGFTYTENPNGLIYYSLTYVNNTATAIIGATVECLLPSTLAFVSGNNSPVVTVSDSAHYVRWTLDIPANSAGVETFTAQVIATVPATVIAPTASLKRGATSLATTTLPKVTVAEPLRFTLGIASDSNSVGDTTHKDEAIKYTLEVKNIGASAIMGVKMGTAFPVGTRYLVASTPPSGTTMLTRGTSGKETGIDWTIATLAPGALVSVFVLVEVTAAENAIITESTATCTRGTTKIIAPSFKTTVLPTLGMELSADKTIARPGEFINYEFTVHNYGIGAISNAKLVNKLPLGVALTSVRTDDGTGNFVDVALNGDNLTPTTNPGIDRSTSIMTWTFASIPAKNQRTVRFTCQVQFDDVTYYYLNNVSVTNEIGSNSYNFVGTPGSGARLFAAKAVGGSAASLVNATSAQLLSITVPNVRSLISGGEPLASPKLALQKEAIADGVEIVAGQRIATLINDATIGSDGTMTYALTISNATGAGTATAVQVHDFIPTGMNFLGFIARDGTNVASYFGFHFFNAVNKEIDATILTNIPLVRSLTMPVGDLAGGHSTSYTYKVQTTLAVGHTIVSNSGGMAGKSGIYTFDPVIGYHLTASNLLFPINGGPRQLKVNVTAPAIFNLPGGIIHSRVEAIGTEFSGIAIPFEVLGGNGLNFAGIKMDIPIPKGFLAQAAQLFDKFGSVIANVVPSAPNSVGVRTLSFPVGALRNATVLFQVALDSANAAVLKNATGQIKAPLAIKPVITGSYTKPAIASLSGEVTAAVVPTPVIMPSLAGLGVLSFRPDPVAKDAKIFVGRSAPAAVRRGRNLTYTIFVGNLCPISLDLATISMAIPAGTTYVSATSYYYNTFSAEQTNQGPDQASNIGSVSIFKPVYSAGKVTWSIGHLAASEAGAVTVTVKVPDTFVGNRIDDNSCNFDVVNASGKSAGPLGVVVLSGNETAQSTSATQAAIEGLGSQFNDGVRTALDTTGFHVTTSTSTVTTGGCDLLHLNNDLVLIPLPHDRMFIIGPSGKVNADGFHLMLDSGGQRIAVGPGILTATSGIGIDVSTLPGLSGTPFITPNSLFTSLSTGNIIAQGGGNIIAQGGGNIIAQGGGNIIASGGGNIVASGGGNLIGQDGAGLTGANAARILMPEGISSLLANSISAKLVTDIGASIVASGGGNIVATGGGNIVATGGGNLIGQDGASLIGNDGAGIVASGAGNLIGQDGAGIVATGGGNLISACTGNLVNQNGVSSLANLK